MHSKSLKIFFSGIGGSGVSAIACFMADKGHSIAGSDRAFDTDSGHPLKKILQSRGILIVPQDGKALDDTFNLAVFSTAVEPDHPEFLKAKSLGIPVKTRPEYLAEITASFKTIAVTGTSGKSTASGMLAFLMSRLGLNPNFIGGARVKQLKSLSNPGNCLTGDSDILVIEACESDGTIVNYRPEHSILLNLRLDHHTVAETADMFKSLIKNTRHKIILNSDDENLNRIKNNNAVTFSINNPSDYRADKIEYKPFSTDFSLHNTRFTLPLPGKFNLYNALSCLAMLSETGFPLKTIAPALSEFKGIDRRFDILLDNGEKLVIDDYAHNPHKISSLMQTVKKLREQVCYIFQPHGFGPTRLMKEQYIKTFAENLRASDILILLPIYYAGGTAAKDISSHDLARGITSAGKTAAVIEDRKEILKIINKYRAYVIFGARDETLTDLAEGIASALPDTK